MKIFNYSYKQWANHHQKIYMLDLLDKDKQVKLFYACTSLANEVHALK